VRSTLTSTSNPRPADLFDASGRYTADWHTLAGVGAGAIALRSGRSLVVVFLLAIATTALTRLIP
jgi:hypothetical protein